MNLYSIALFVHVVGALLLFVTLTVEGVALRQLSQAAAIEPARAGAAMLRLNRIGGPFSALRGLVPRVYMTLTTLGWGAWIVVALVAWVRIAVPWAPKRVRTPALAPL